MKIKLLTCFGMIGMLMLSNPVTVWAQCAMCRTQLENNVSNGEPGVAAGINTGILYLLVLPYLSIMVVGYFWYKNTRKNGSSRIHKSVIAG